jgi:hypothetical protein
MTLVGRKVKINNKTPREWIAPVVLSSNDLSQVLTINRHNPAMNDSTACFGIAVTHLLYGAECDHHLLPRKS